MDVRTKLPARRRIWEQRARIARQNILSHSRDPAGTLRSIASTPSRRLAVCRTIAIATLPNTYTTAHDAFRLTPASTPTPPPIKRKPVRPRAPLSVSVFAYTFLEYSLTLLCIRARVRISLGSQASCVLYLLGIYLTPVDCLTQAERPHLQNQRPHPNRVGVLPPRRVPRLALLPAVLGGPLRLGRVG
ncbi:hypothetical protein K438DRAFT_2029494 [Mycena galopus ATCC 62051]|nr:hypothetical protein K438DRAFT_2029494 [Mycena galopus ATCC 62051]